MNLLNTLINNIYIIEITQLNNGGDWCNEVNTSYVVEFLDSFNNTIESYTTYSMNIEPLVKEASVLFY